MTDRKSDPVLDLSDEAFVDAAKFGVSIQTYTFAQLVRLVAKMEPQLTKARQLAKEQDATPNFPESSCASLAHLEAVVAARMQLVEGEIERRLARLASVREG